jgi:hypothetical protein
LQSELIFKDFLDSFPPYIRQMMEYLIWQESISKQDAEKITGRELIVNPGDKLNNTYSYKLIDGLHLFRILGFPTYADTWQSTWKQIYSQIWLSFSLPPLIRSIIEGWFPKPAGYYIIPVALPNDASLKFFNAEPSIVSEVQRVSAYYLHNNIKYSSKGKPAALGMNKIQRTLSIKEFFENKTFSSTRTLLMFGLIYRCPPTILQGDTISVIRYLFANNYINFQKYAHPAPYVFTQLKGIADLYPHSYIPSVNPSLLNIIKQLPEGEWITFANLYRYIQTHFIIINPFVPGSGSIYYDQKDGNLHRFNRREYIGRDNEANMISKVYLKGTLFLMASFGLLEISYKETDDTKMFGKDWFSEYDGIHAVKLTALGSYITGVKRHYEPLGIAQNNRLDFDENALFLRVEGDLALINTLLENYMEKVSDSRYIFNSGYFLRDCKTTENVKNKIAAFKQIIAKKLPDYWENYLVSLYHNAKQVEIDNEMFVFTISSSNKELQRLIVQDLVLKKLVLKAERFNILIEKSNLTTFRNRMKELGYLIKEE